VVACGDFFQELVTVAFRLHVDVALGALQRVEVLRVVLFVGVSGTDVSAAFALVPWPYLTIPSLLILIVFMLGNFREASSIGRRTGVGSGRELPGAATAS